MLLNDDGIVLSWSDADVSAALDALSGIDTTVSGIEERLDSFDDEISRLSDIAAAVPFFLGCIFGAVIIHQFFRRL